MLTIADLIAFNVGVLIFGIFGIIFFVASTLVGIRNKDNAFIVIFGGIGLICTVIPGIYILGSNVTTETITPCDIIKVSDDSVFYYISDINSDTVYKASSEMLIRVHLNQTAKADVIRGLFNDYPTIVKSYGKLCTTDGC